MQQLILKVKKKEKMPFLKELLTQMDFVEIIEPSKKKASKKSETLKNLEDSVKFVNDYKKRKVKAKSFEELLNEI